MCIKEELLKELKFDIKIPLEFIEDKEGLKIIYDKSCIKVYYADLRQYCRAFLILLVSICLL